MSSSEYANPASVIEPDYFSNWGDLWYPKLANKLLIPASEISILTPNHITIASFVLYSTGAGLIIAGGRWSVLATALLPLSYILDCLDGQLARYTGRTSPIGDYLDKTLDVLKIFIINASMAFSAYRLTGKSFFFAPRVAVVLWIPVSILY
jgi:phosphatidylglycerophosphate synthase